MAEAQETELVADLRAAGHHLLAGLVGWHRREAKPQWWDFYRVSDLTDDELVRDGTALGGRGPPTSQGPLPKPVRSTIWRYPFPPQETKVHDKAADVDTHDMLGDIVRLNPAEGWLDLKVATNKPAPRPRGLGSEKPST